MLESLLGREITLLVLSTLLLIDKEVLLAPIETTTKLQVALCVRLLVIRRVSPSSLL